MDPVELLDGAGRELAALMRAFPQSFEDDPTALITAAEKVVSDKLDVEPPRGGVDLYSFFIGMAVRAAWAILKEGNGND